MGRSGLPNLEIISACEKKVQTKERGRGRRLNWININFFNFIEI